MSNKREDNLIFEAYLKEYVHDPDAPAPDEQLQAARKQAKEEARHLQSTRWMTRDNSIYVVADEHTMKTMEAGRDALLRGHLVWYLLQDRGRTIGEGPQREYKFTSVDEFKEHMQRVGAKEWLPGGG